MITLRFIDDPQKMFGRTFKFKTLAAARSRAHRNDQYWEARNRSLLTAPIDPEDQILRDEEGEPSSRIP